MYPFVDFMTWVPAIDPHQFVQAVPFGGWSLVGFIALIAKACGK